MGLLKYKPEERKGIENNATRIYIRES